jgi:hypothetical protein
MVDEGKEAWRKNYQIVEMCGQTSGSLHQSSLIGSICAVPLAQPAYPNHKNEKGALTSKIQALIQFKNTQNNSRCFDNHNKLVDFQTTSVRPDILPMSRQQLT